MALSISKALNIESHERGIVLLLLTQSVFIGIFAGALDVGANALFLEAYSADLMPQAFMISGAVGIFFTSVYTWFQKKIPFKIFTILNLLIAVLLTAGLRLGYRLTDDPRLSFVLLVMMGPVVIIALLGFWGTAGRYFTLREGKRLFGIIDTGSIVGMIVAFYAVPFLVTINFQVHDTLLIGLVSLLLALVFQIVVLQRHSLREVKEHQSERRRSGFRELFRKRYTSLMAFFVVLSVVVAFFIHYSFMWATEANYEDTRELTSFLGAFFGTMMIFTVILKSTLYGWLMKNYGLRITLLLSPALLLILTLVASVVGGAFGYGPEAASFTLFFLVIALSKLFNRSLKDSIESPSMKILYQSLDSSERFDVQARIDGVVNEFTAFFAGLIMAGLLLLSFVTVIHFSYLLIILLVVWVIIGSHLYRSYRKTLNDSLATARRETQEDATAEFNLHVSAETQSGLIHELLVLDPYAVHSTDKALLQSLLVHPVKEKQELAWRIATEKLLYLGPPESFLAQIKEIDSNPYFKQYRLRWEMPGKKIDNAFHSQDFDTIQAALIQTIEEKDTAQVPNIITLLRDRNMRIRSSAIETAGYLKAKELGSYLVDYLGHPDLYDVTYAALVNMGENILENLENAFHKTGTSVKVQLRIVRAMTEIGGDNAHQYLFQKLNFHQREIRESAIAGLYESSFSPGMRERTILHGIIYDVVKSGAMNLSAAFVVKEHNPENGLYEAMVEEIRRNDELLFKLLGITYERNAIQHVQRSIENTEEEDTGYALELLNLIVEDEVFAYLENYFDDLSVNEKIRRLQYEMPVEITSYQETLIELLHRDGLFTGDYVRLCTIDAIRLADELEAAAYLASQAFNPDPLIRRPSTEVLAEKDPDFYADIAERKYNFGEKKRITQVESLVADYRELMDLTKELQDMELYAEISREHLLSFIRNLRPVPASKLNDTTKVTLIKSAIEGSQIPAGSLINLAEHPGILDQMEYIASGTGMDIYQADRNVMREFLFDKPELLSVFRKLYLELDDITSA